MKKDRMERAIRIKERKEIRKKNVADFFLFFSRHHREWLYELAARYKAAVSPCGDTQGTVAAPFVPMNILPSFYSVVENMEIAAFAALLLKDDAGFEEIQELRGMLGNSPMEWFKNREFVGLSVGRMQDKRTGGVENWKIAKLFDRLWHECYGDTETHGTIGAAVSAIAKTQHCQLFDALTYLFEDCGVGSYNYKLRLLLMILGTRGGIGLDLWDIPKDELLCPLASGIRQFVQTWFPDHGRYGGLNDAIKLFGFEGDCDFLYAYWGYKELQKRSPNESGQYSTRYNTWYGLGSNMKKNRWKGILPEIPF